MQQTGTKKSRQYFESKRSTDPESIHAKRAELKELSRVIKMAVKEGIYNSVNEGLAEAYAQEGHTTLKSYRRWKEEGYQVKKGSKALLLWGEKRGKETPEPAPENKTGENEGYDFFPVAYVFSNLQVEKIAS